MEADDARQQHELAELEHAEVELADVEHALRRLDDGTYGTCESCGGPIGDAVLAGDPAARRCAEHATPAG